MRLPLRYFLLACLLLGAVGVPWGWRVWESRRAAEIERLEKELGELLSDHPPGPNEVYVFPAGEPKPGWWQRI